MCLHELNWSNNQCFSTLISVLNLHQHPHHHRQCDGADGLSFLRYREGLRQFVWWVADEQTWNTVDIQTSGNCCGSLCRGLHRIPGIIIGTVHKLRSNLKILQIFYVMPKRNKAKKNQDFSHPHRPHQAK